MRPAIAVLASFSFGGVTSACGSTDELLLSNRLSSDIRVEVLAPRAEGRGDCSREFRNRFCGDDFASIGVVDVGSGEERRITAFDSGSGGCDDVLWVRLPWIGSTGPVPDVGTIFSLPAVAVVEKGVGRYHGVGFPGWTVRIDELGPADRNQGLAPAPCTGR